MSKVVGPRADARPDWTGRAVCGGPVYELGRTEGAVILTLPLDDACQELTPVEALQLARDLIDMVLSKVVLSKGRDG